MSGEQNGNGGPPPFMHFLKALSHGAMAVGHLMTGGNPDEDEDSDEDEAPARPRRKFKVRKKGPCCTAKRK